MLLLKASKLEFNDWKEIHKTCQFQVVNQGRFAKETLRAV